MEISSIFDLIGLGAIAGLFPVYLGILIALMVRKIVPRTVEGLLIGLATGVLIYLFFDLMHEAVERTGARDSLSWMILLGSLFVSFVGVVALEQSQMRGSRPLDAFLSLPYMIAIGMGLHNLGEGLAIGASYAHGEWVLSALLVMGFALHNGTEGFGIVGSAGQSSLGTTDIILLGLIAGAPTCLGTVLSGHELSPYFTVAFYALAAGSLLYVIVALVAMYYTATRRMQVALGIFCGISLMYITAMVLTLISGIQS